MHEITLQILILSTMEKVILLPISFYYVCKDKEREIILMNYDNFLGLSFSRRIFGEIYRENKTGLLPSKFTAKTIWAQIFILSQLRFALILIILPNLQDK